MKDNRAARRLPPSLIVTTVLCAAIAALVAGGFSLTYAPLIHLYIVLGYTTPESIVHIYNLTALPLIHAGFGATIGASLWTFSRCIRWRPKSILGRNVFLAGAGLAVVIIAGGVIMVEMASWMFYSPPAPSLEIYEEAFPANQSSLNELVMLLKAHPNLAHVNQIGQGDGDDTDTIDSGTKPRYLNLLKATAVKRPGFLPDGSMCFEEWQDSWLLSDSDETGYSYSETPPANVLPSLDGLSCPYKSTYSAAHRIRGNWYVYYQHLPGS